MKTIVNLDTWSRKEHFEFFNAMENPYWGLVATVDLSQAMEIIKPQNNSIYTFYLHQILKTVNEIEELKFRIENEQVVKYDQINVSPANLRPDKSFGFSYVDFDMDYARFDKNLKQETQEVNKTQGLNFTTNALRQDVIHFSALPWIHFTSLSHATSSAPNQSVPRISVGKIVNHKLPISIEVHHGFVDGYHIGLFFQKLQDNLNHYV
ncbi:MAG: CatA-like O-acetyltransferase [Flavobacteriaceae bacterium]